MTCQWIWLNSHWTINFELRYVPRLQFYVEYDRILYVYLSLIFAELWSLFMFNTVTKVSELSQTVELAPDSRVLHLIKAKYGKIGHTAFRRQAGGDDN